MCRRGNKFAVLGLEDCRTVDLAGSTVLCGDLIDTVERDGTLLAYVADISGHGLWAGQLMGHGMCFCC
jgi:serine phosphatase RsbU (regulator of sigma subunit)